MSLGLFDSVTSSLGYHAQVVAVTKADYDGYYYDAGVKVIWPVWCDVQEDVAVNCSGSDPLLRYRLVNRRISEQIRRRASAGTVVSIHDYQFMLAPRMLRAYNENFKVAYFHHTPFPDPDSLSSLPTAIAEEIVLGLLGADLVGFQCALWARRFLACCERRGFIVDHDRGKVFSNNSVSWVRSYPLRVDSTIVSSQANSSSAVAWSDRIRAEGKRRIIARVDRLDPTKNVLRGFEAYEQVLNRLPDDPIDLQFVSCLIPSRQQVSDYRDYAERVERTVARVNNRYPGSIVVHEGDDRDRAFGLLRISDLLLVNSVADGMNLVAQEAALINCNDGAIVLSKMAGAADLLPGAIPLDLPKSTETTANAIELALSLSEQERRRRASKMRQALLCGETPESWFDHQLVDLCAVTSGAEPCCSAP